MNDAGTRFLGLGTARGALVAGIAENSPAKAAGLMLGDVIVKFDGKEIRLPRDLAGFSSSMPVGRQVEVVIVRKSQEVTKTVTLGLLEDRGNQMAKAESTRTPPETESTSAKALGLAIAPLGDDARAVQTERRVKGVVVASVEPHSPAAGTSPARALFRRVRSRRARP